MPKVLKRFGALVSLALVAHCTLSTLSVLSCATPRIQLPSPSDPITRTCAAHGVQCAHGFCCEEGQVCGAPRPNFPDGTCEYEGDP